MSTNFLPFAKIDGANDVVILSWTKEKNFIAKIYSRHMAFDVKWCCQSNWCCVQKNQLASTVIWFSQIKAKLRLAAMAALFFAKKSTAKSNFECIGRACASAPASREWQSERLGLSGHATSALCFQWLVFALCKGKSVFITPPVPCVVLWASCGREMNV